MIWGMVQESAFHKFPSSGDLYVNVQQNILFRNTTIKYIAWLLTEEINYTVALQAHKI